MYLKKHRCGIFSADRTHTSSEFDKRGPGRPRGATLRAPQPPPNTPGV